ncbi:MAG TPA: hypothetical protein VLQ92_07605 [Candidatus Limnocylindrales bacterium]|nr:hypothetical protein [Candidatus Limnocylindrales bacterium]
MYDWEPLDRAVENAMTAGATEIQYVFGVAPQWAAAKPTMNGFYGLGTSSPPATMAYFTDFAWAMADRYRGRITSYEIWNEGSIKVFFGGTSKQLADLTIKGARAIRSADPAAKVLAPSSTYGVFTRRPKFWKDFAKRLQKAKWPVQAVNIHPYSKTPDYLSKREKYISQARTFYRKYGFKGPIWDTEVNYGDRRNMFEGFQQISYSGDVAAGMVARTYIDAMRMGVPRVFWYGWDYHLFGIDMIDPGTGAQTEAGVAFHTVQDWMVGKQWRGCTTKKYVRTCKLRGPDGARTTIVYATSKTRTYKIPAGVGTFQNLAGEFVAVVPGQKIKVNAVPLLLQGA